MENCSCGVVRKQYWLWRDANGILHASGFEPSNGVEGSVIAVNARDALLPLVTDEPPKHDVTDVSSSDRIREGRCGGLRATA